MLDFVKNDMTALVAVQDFLNMLKMFKDNCTINETTNSKGCKTIPSNFIPLSKPTKMEKNPSGIAPKGDANKKIIIDIRAKLQLIRLRTFMFV